MNANMTIEELQKAFQDTTKENVVNDQDPSVVVKTEEEEEDVINNDTPPVIEAEKGDLVISPFFDEFEEKLLKTNKLLAFTTEDGADYVKPKSWEDIVELVEANLKLKEEESEKKISELKEEEWAEKVFSKMSPAMQFIAKNANQFTDIHEMLPLIESVQTQDFFATLDPEKEDDQEKIVRLALQIQGLDIKSIEEEIIDLKERDKLKVRSERLKPTLDSFQASQTEKILKQRELENKKQQDFMLSYYNSLKSSLLDSPEISGMKIEKSDRVKIANNLLPAQDGSGMPIYSKLEEKVSSGDFETLTLASLLLEDRALFDSYYSSKINTNLSKDLQKTLRKAVTSNSTQVLVDQTKQAAKKAEEMKYGIFK